MASGKRQTDPWKIDSLRLLFVIDIDNAQAIVVCPGHIQRVAISPFQDSHCRRVGVPNLQKRVQKLALGDRAAQKGLGWILWLKMKNRERRSLCGWAPAVGLRDEETDG